MNSEKQIVNVNDFWKHHSGTIYKVLMITNVDADKLKHEDFPVTVVYENAFDKSLWSRPLDVFTEKFEYLEVDAETRSYYETFVSLQECMNGPVYKVEADTYEEFIEWLQNTNQSDA